MAREGPGTIYLLRPIIRKLGRQATVIQRLTQKPSSSLWVCNAVFFTKPIDLLVNLIAHSSGFFQSLFVRPGEFRRIVKGPVQTSGYAWKNWTPFGFGFTADRYDKLEHLAWLPNI